jgi:tetratricopeptide (TPR) repeat protein
MSDARDTSTESPAPPSPAPDQFDKSDEAAMAEDAASNVISEDYKKMFPPHDRELLDSLRNSSAAEIAKYDPFVADGLNSFFNNDFAKADALFRGTYKDDPLCASAWGTLGSIKALLSFAPKDIEFASNQLIYAAAFGNGVQPKSEGVMKGLSNWWNRKTTRLTPFQFRALLVVGESELLRANVLLIQDTMTGYLKAGLALRRGYNIYDRLQKYMLEFKDDHGADPNSIGGVYFGLGAIHLVTSILPPKILIVLKALGYMHDRDVGMDFLQKCLKSRTLRSPIASLLLLAFHGILPSFAPLTMARNVPLAEKVIEETLAMFPKSVIHLWLSGRVERLKRNTDGAIRIFKNCMDHSTASLREALPQLEHFALYDLAWAYMSKADWLSALHCFRRLEAESAWSRMFYTYAQAACLDMVAVDAALEDEEAKRYVLTPQTAPESDEEAKQIATSFPNGGTDDDQMKRKEILSGLEPLLRVKVVRILARRLLQCSLGCLSFKVGGKIISIEQFVKRRLRQKLAFVRTADQEALHDDPASFDADETRKMSEGTDGEFDAAQAVAQDDCPLRLVTGIELANHFNVFMQTERKDVEKLLAYCQFFEENAQSRTVPEDAAVVRIIRANLLQQLKIPECAEIYSDLVNAPPFEDEKWIQPYALYGRGVWEYMMGDEAASRETLTKTMQKKFGGKDYNFEMQMVFRLHLTQDMFRRDEAEAKVTPSP